MSPAPNQRERLVQAEKDLGLGPVAMAAELGTSYSNYCKWKNESRTMTPVAWKCLELLKVVRQARL